MIWAALTLSYLLATVCDDRMVMRMQDFGEHGREFVSSETGLRLLQLLASEAELAEFCERQEIELDPLRRALQHTVLEVRTDDPQCFLPCRSRVSCGLL